MRLQHPAIASLCLACGVLPAQSVWPYLHEITWPSLDSIARIEIGRFQSQKREHAFALSSSGHLYFVFAPAQHESVTEITGIDSLTDIVTIPGQDIERSNALLAVGNRQPVILEGTPDGNFATIGVLTGQWNNARSLTARHFTALGETRVAAVNSQGDGILLASQANDASLVEAPLIHVGYQVSAVELVDWDHDGEPEVVALTATHILPFEFDGQPLAPRSLTFEGAETTVLVDGVDSEVLVVAGTVMGETRVTTVDAGGYAQSTTVDSSLLGVTGPLSLLGLDSLDADRDGRGDLLISQNSAHGAIVMLHGPTVADPFNRDDPLVVVPSTVGDPADNVCPAVWGDLDQDDGFDVLFGLDASQELIVAFDVTNTTYALRFSTTFVDLALYDGLNLAILFPLHAVLPNDTMEYVLWRQSDPLTNPNAKLSPVAEAHAKLDANSPELLVSPLGVLLILPLHPDIPGEPYWPNHDHYYLEVRFSSVVEQTIGPFETIGITMVDEPFSPTPTVTLNNFTAAHPSFAYINTLDNLGGDTLPVTISLSRPEYVGIVVTRRELPAFAPGVPAPGEF